MKHAFGLDIPQTLEDICDPTRMALMVYDMQVGILRQLPTAPQIIPRVTEVVRAARDGGYRILHTRYVSLPLELTGATHLRMAMAWQRTDSIDRLRSAFPPDAPQTQLIPEITPLRSEAVFDRIGISAFVGTPLDLVLKDCRIHAVAIVGVALEVGVEPTARHAADLGFIPIVVTDACGGRDEVAMERSLAGLRFAGDAILTDVATICRLLRKSAPDGQAEPSTSPSGLASSESR